MINPQKYENETNMNFLLHAFHKHSKQENLMKNFTLLLLYYTQLHICNIFAILSPIFPHPQRFPRIKKLLNYITS